MVNADTAPALPWGACSEESHVDRNNHNSALQRSVDASTVALDHVDTRQEQVTMPSVGSIIEVCHVTKQTLQGQTANLMCYTVQSGPPEHLHLQVRWQLEEDHKTETIVRHLIARYCARGTVPAAKPTDCLACSGGKQQL